jgi:outer membrane protein assembly factor BamB
MRPSLPLRSRVPVVLAVLGVVILGGALLGLSHSSPAPVAAGGHGADASSSPAGDSSPTGAGPTSANSSAAAPSPSPSASSDAIFPGGLLIADRANGRILVVNDAGTVLWRFPKSPADLPKGQAFSADDAFIAPDHRTIVANDEFHEVIDRIDIATGRIVWQYGRYASPGPAKGQLHTPDDGYPLANGDIVVADIENCRILEIAPDKSIARQWGRTGDCVHKAGVSFARPNGDTPLPDGGILITEIHGSRVVRLAADGHVVFDIHVPVVYPSDAQLDPNGNVVVADFSKHGQVVCVDPTGKLVWRYAPSSGPGALDHPSLATPLPSGLVSVNDDFRHRIVVIDPQTGKIVWQYGRTDRNSTALGYLDTPDGHEPMPPGVFQ